MHGRDDDGWTILHYSARYGSYELFKHFADMGGDIYPKSKNGSNCLHIAAMFGHLNLCKILIDQHNFDIHMAEDDGWTALHHSARYGSYELLRYFVKMGVDIHLKSKNGSNCLHIAAMYGHLNLCKLLIDKHKFDIHMPDKVGWTAVHYSARYGSYELFRYFADMRVDIYLKTNNDLNCLHIAAMYGHLNLCKLLIDKHNFDIHMAADDGWTALHHSTRYSSYELFRYFAEMGVDIYLKSKNGSNCLHIAAMDGHLNLCKLLIEKHKFDIDVPDNDGWTAVHYSARYGSYELLRYFAEMGVDIHLKSKNGSNCLHIAAMYGHLNLCKVLIEKHKFDIDVPDNDRWTAVHYSARYGSYELFTYFADMEVDIYLKTNNDLNCLHIAAMYEHLNLCKLLIDKHNFDIHMAADDGWTALHHSARCGSYELFRYFADMGVDIYLKSKTGSNCLHIAAMDGHLNLCKVLIEKHKFDIHMAADDGWTAVHHSARYGSYELFRYFAEIGVDIYLKSKNGSNCLHIAAMDGHLNLCKLLIEKHKFDIDVPDNDGWTAVHCSARYGSYELFRYFSDMGVDIYLKTNNDLNCLHIAAMYGHLNLCKLLIDKHNFDIHMAADDGWTALHHSARYGSSELFRYFADMGVDIYLKSKNGSNCLHIAAMDGHLNLCKVLIEKHKFDIDVPDNDGWTAVHYSARYGSYELLRYFAEMGVDIYLKNKNGSNCLHIAAMYGHLNLCKLLTDKHNFDIHMAADDGWTAVHHSARYGSYELFRYFAEMGVDIYLKSKNGSNCLHIAAMDGHLNLCKLLIEKHKFDIDVPDNDGWAAVHCSARYGSYELFRYFADMGVDIYLKTNNDLNCLHIAAMYGHLNLCKLLIDKHNFDIHMAADDGWTALHHSTRYSSYELFRYFAEMGVDIYLKSKNGSNCLHIAAMDGHLNLCKLLIEKHKFDIDVPDNDGWTAVHYSARYGSYELLRYFAEMGVDIHLKSKNGSNCLHIAAMYGHLNLCKVLIEKHKFDIDVPDNDRWTAVHYSARYGSYELFTYFADMGVDIYLKTNNDLNCLHIAAMYEHLNLCKLLIDKHNFDIHMAADDGWTALHHSARCGSYELFRYFSDMGVDIYLKSKTGSNCLHIAAMDGHLNLCKLLIDKHNFDIHMAADDGWTALHHSARYGSSELFRYFADMGVDIYLKSKNGSNCLHIAAMYGHLNLCRIVIEQYKFDIHMSDNDGWTAAHCSARYGSYELFRYFSDMGVDIYLKTNNDLNCLHIAAMYGHLNLCKLLIDKHNFDIHMAADDGWTALHHSARYGSSELFRYFADMGVDIYLKSKNGSNCLHIAAMYGHLNLCRIVIEQYKFDIHMSDNDGWTAAHCSARYGSYELFRYFAEIGVDIYLKTKNGSNCLHIAAMYGYLNLCNILIDKHKFDIHMPDNDGWTAVHCSARYGSYELFRCFADMGGDIYLKSKNGSNCLHIAAMYGHLNLCKVLIDTHKFDIDVPDNDGWTAVHCSARYGSYELFKFFADMGFDIYLKSKNGSNCLHIAAMYGHLNLCKVLIDTHKFDIDVPDNEGWTAVHCSARYGSYELFKFFADMGFDIYLKSKNGSNCLHIAAMYGHLNLCKVLIDTHKFDIDVPDNDGWTAVHCSARYGSYELFRCFADMGGDIYLKSKNGSNCLDIAGHIFMDI